MAAPPRRRIAGDDGSAVAEFAVALPAVLLVLSLAIGGVQVGSLQVRAQGAAADAARSYARGESAGTVQSRLQRQLPGASVARSASGDLVCASIAVRPPGALGRLGVQASARSCALDRGL